MGRGVCAKVEWTCAGGGGAATYSCCLNSASAQPQQWDARHCRGRYGHS
jgi:hypothetical protein